MAEKGQHIKNIIDNHLKRWEDLGINMQPGEIEPQMADPEPVTSEGWRKWNAIESTVQNKDIQELESKTGVRFPPDYKCFLKHKHFYDLQIAEVSFCRHPVNTWQEELRKMIFNGFPSEFLIDKGYLPFADWSDWGQLCFDTNSNSTDNNYPVVLWDHERPHQVEGKHRDFYNMLIQIDQEAKKNEH